MAYEIRWDMLGAPVNVGASVNAGFERGREMRMRGEQERAFSLLADDPDNAEGRALLVESGRPDLARQFRQWGREDRREDMWRSAFGANPAVATPATPPAAAFPTATAPNTPPAPAPARPAAPAAPPAASQALPPLNPTTMRQFFAEDPEGAQQFVQAWNQLDGLQRATETRRYASAVPILSELARLPVESRAAEIAANQSYLLSHGWTAEELQSFASDPSDQRIRRLIRLGVPIAEQREFFAPIEGGAGQVYRDPVTLGVQAANPAPPRTEQSYDANGNQMFVTVPGTPAIGPGASLFGQPQPTENLPTPASPDEARRLPPGTRFRLPDGTIGTVPGGQSQSGSGNFRRAGLTINRNNNPGALRIPGSSQFQRFGSAAEGIRAQESLLRRRYLGRGLRTVADIVETYAPRISRGGDNTDEQVNNYIRHVSTRLGVRPGQVIDPERVSELARAMREFETGKR